MAEASCGGGADRIRRSGSDHRRASMEQARRGATNAEEPNVPFVDTTADIEILAEGIRAGARELAAAALISRSGTVAS